MIKIQRNQIRFENSWKKKEFFYFCHPVFQDCWKMPRFLLETQQYRYVGPLTLSSLVHDSLWWGRHAFQAGYPGSPFPSRAAKAVTCCSVVLWMRIWSLIALILAARTGGPCSYWSCKEGPWLRFLTACMQVLGWFLGTEKRASLWVAPTI